MKRKASYARWRRPGVAHLRQLLLFNCLILVEIGTVKAAEFPVSSAAEIASILPSVRPGDAIVMQNGTWANQQINFSALGTPSQPITLRAETPGQVVLNGNSSLNITGDWLVADGLRFDGGALGSNDHIVEFRGNRGPATNSRLTNSAIVNYNPASIDTRYFWVSLYGQNNRVDHNYFSGQNHSGVTVVVWRNSDDADYHRIDSNFFDGRPEGNANGFETIRVGTSDFSLSDSFTEVDNNLFQSTDGEAEIISNKSGNNSYRYNTFRSAAGTLTLRHGNDNLVAGNFFLGEDKSETGGVRVIGERQMIVNNYFANLDGRAGGAISISAGVPNSPLNGYYQVKDTLIAHNTIVDVQEAAITFDDGLGSSGRTLLAENVTLANNLVRSTSDPLFEGVEGTGWTWQGNIAYGQSLGPVVGNPGVQNVNPLLVQDAKGLWRPTTGSPAIDGAIGDYSSIIFDDMDGQARIGMADVGADEFSLASIVRRPLQAGDVGPDWMMTGGGSCLTDGLAVQAEDYSAILDPDADNVNWLRESSALALGGTTMRSPLHNTVNRPVDPHESLLVYDIEFQQEGTYTAYYRGRGFDGGSDSIYVADDFGIDPEVVEVLSNDGVYTWEVGGTFQITASDISVPLEFRVGTRERFADFDAFVFHQNSALSDAELDALFGVDCRIDFNADGQVDCVDVDLLVAEIVVGGDSEAFDLTGDGLVDQADLASWLLHAGSINISLGSSYLFGDANLDGIVDTSDFNVWNTNKFASGGAWCSGDFNADGVVDASDFNLWNQNKFQSAFPAVPEPSSRWLGIWAALAITLRQRRIVRNIFRKARQ